MPSDQWVVLIHSSCLEGSERELWGHLPVYFLGVGRGPIYISILLNPFLHLQPHPTIPVLHWRRTELKPFHIRESDTER